MAFALVGVSGCVTAPARAPQVMGSWFMKEGAAPEDSVSRKLLVGVWRGDSTDVHAVRRVEDSTLYANGTYMIHFVEMTESGAVSIDQTECGLWGVSGDVYFTITQFTRQGSSAQPASPFDPSFYDAYRIVTLTTSVFEMKHNASGQLSRLTRVANVPSTSNWRVPAMPLLSPCEASSA